MNTSYIHSRSEEHGACDLAWSTAGILMRLASSLTLCILVHNFQVTQLKVFFLMKTMLVKGRRK